MEEDRHNRSARSGPRPGRSMLGPTILITAGILLLLSNVNLLPDLDWSAVLCFWPLLLLFIGLNLIAGQVRRPIGTGLSLILSLIFVAVSVYILMFAGRISPVAELSGAVRVNPILEQVSYPAKGVTTADIKIDFSAAGAHVYSLEDRQYLLEADITYLDKILYETNISEGDAAIILDTDDEKGRFFWLNPATWVNGEFDNQWQIGLNNKVPLNLDLDLSSGPVRLGLDELNLTSLAVDGSSGSVQLVLPGGDYDMEYDVGSGPVEMILPTDGDHSFMIDGGDGSLTILIPISIEARLVSEGGGGRLRINTDRLTQVEESSEEDYIAWESEKYGNADDRANLLIDPGSGDVVIQEQ